MSQAKRVREKGAAVIELSLGLPMMLLLLFGVVEFGQAFTVRESLISAASEAARIGSESSCPRATEEEVLAAARQTLTSAGLDASLATIVLTNTGGESGTDFVVDVSYEAQFPVLSKLLNAAWLSGESMEITVSVDAENE